MATGEYVFTGLGIGMSCLTLLGALACLLAEMRYRRKAEGKMRRNNDQWIMQVWRVILSRLKPLPPADTRELQAAISSLHELAVNTHMKGSSR